MSVSESLPVMYVDCSPFSGGAQRSFADLIGAVRRHGVEPRVLASDSSPGGLIAACSQAGIETHTAPCRHWRRSLSGLLLYALDRRRWGRVLASRLSAWHPSVVHVNGIRSALLTCGRMPAGLPVILHDRDVRGPAAVLRRVSRDVSHVIAISAFVGRRWSGLISDDRVSTIWNGFDVERIGAVSPTADWPGSRSAFRPILVADLMRWKGHALYLDAIASLQCKPVGPVSAVLVGRPRGSESAAYLSELRAGTHALGLTDSVRFVTDASDALPWIAAADVVVSAAEGEPFGRTVVEGLALGKPVVAVRGGGPDEILGPCSAGTLVDADAGAIAAGLRRWLCPQERQAAAPAALGRARDFSLAAAAARVSALYRDILPGDTGTRS